MSGKRLFVLNGHPAETSLNRALAQKYADDAWNAGHEVRITHLHDLQFDPDYEFGGYSKHKPLEADLEQVVENLEWAEHVIVVTPMWWGGMPAKLKGVFDRALLPGRAFDTRNTNFIGLPAPLLAGRSARVIVTADTPRAFLSLAYRGAMLWQLRVQILKFVGFNPVRVTYFSGASHPKDSRVKRWFATVGKLGAAAS